MTVYVVKAETELQVVSVQPEQEAKFLEEWSNKVIVSGDNIREALANFNDLPISFVSRE